MDKLYVEKIASDYYTRDGYDHVMRVANYVKENPVIPSYIKDCCETLAIMHDLLEDTEYEINNLSNTYFRKCLLLLTKPQNMNYIDYIKQIRENAIIYPEAYWVKLADMKDHLTQTETLTDKLKEKYLAALPYLL